MLCGIIWYGTVVKRLAPQKVLQKTRLENIHNRILLRTATMA